MNRMDPKALALFESFRCDGTVEVGRSTSKGVVMTVFLAAMAVLLVFVGLSWMGEYETLYLVVPFGAAAFLGFAAIRQAINLVGGGALVLDQSGFRIGSGPVIAWDTVERFHVRGARRTAADKSNYTETVTVHRLPGSSPTKVMLPDSLQIPSTSLAHFMQSCQQAATGPGGH